MRPFFWYVLGATAVWYALIFGLHAALPGVITSFALGTLFWIPLLVVAGVVVSDPSAAAWASGADTEELTSGALRRGLGRDYFVLDDVQFERGNIDHVFLGPAGLFVVETKWSSKPWASARGGSAQSVACKQARNSARVLMRRLEPTHPGINAQPIVVLWGGNTRAWEKGTLVRNVEGMPVIAGIGLSNWASELESSGLSGAQLAALLESLKSI